MASPTTINKLLFVATTFASIFVNNLTLANIPRPRGVPITKAPLYYPLHETDWQCLDGSRILRYLQINDDYCDCMDGSDEPGTSACSNGLFHCANIGHNAIEISTSRVDDGVCDCCDGSDEAGTVQCPNTCLELGKAEQEKMLALSKILKKGSTKRRDMITKGRQIKAERIARKAELEKRRNEHNSVKQEKETLKKAAEAAEAEALEFYKEMQREKDAVASEEAKIAGNPQAMRVEAEQVFLRYDTNKDGFVEVTELQIDMTLDRDRNGVVTVEEAKYFLDERDRMDFENFLTLSWPRIKPIQMLAEGLFKPPQKADTIGDITDEQADLRKHSDQDDHQQDVDEGFDGEEEEEEPYEDEEIDTGVGTATVETTPAPEYDSETQRLIDIANQARNAVSQVESELREIDQEIKELEEHNGRDYGTEDEFVTLDGECFDYEDREYIYTFCPYIRAPQKPKNGGSETTLGRWEGWLVEGNSTYIKQKYSHGASCWNGPQRSVIVQFSCALENRITSVSEPNRCEYFYEFDTPAACKEAYVPLKEEKHDEL